ncbi:MAG: DUF4910 domain-containing protein [Planctomycetota bacterium]|jgi:hypothetical protein
MIFDMQLVHAVCDTFSGSQAKREVEQLSQFHRIQASPGFHAAAKHVMARLKEIGVRTRMHRFPADGRKKYFTWTSPMGWEGESATLELVKPEAKLLGSFPDVPCALTVHSKSADVEANVVDVETGATAAEYKGKNVRGKIVLVRGRPRSVFREAIVRRGAVGVLAYLPDRPEEPDMIPYTAFWPDASEARKLGFGFSLSRREALRLKSLLAAGKKVRVRAKVKARLFPSHLDVVEAELPGRGPAVLFTAHLCHPQPGANDNASGAAVLIEIARTLRKLKLKLRRPVRFLWVPEMYGTIAYLHRFRRAASRTLCCINLDMVGENLAACNSRMRLKSAPWSVPTYLSDLVGEALEAVKKHLKPDPCGTRGLLHFAQEEYAGGSDHYVFAESTWGVPAVQIGHWPDTFYHTHADTPDRVDATELARSGVAATLSGVFAASARPAEAEALSVAVEGRGQARMSEVVTQGFEHLRACAKKDLAAEFHRVRRHVETACLKEEAAACSVRDLARSGALEQTLETARAGFALRAATALAKLEGYVHGRLGKTPAEPKNGKLRRLGRLVPVRRFEGPLAMDVLRRTPRQAAYYAGVMKDDRNGKRLYETVNFMDGTRTLLDIWRMVDAEFPFYDTDLLERFISDLKKARLVRLR